REIHRLQFDLVTVGVVTVTLGRCSGKVQKEVIEAAILLNDEDDVRYRRRDGARARNRAGCGKRLCGGPVASGHCEHRRRRESAKEEPFHTTTLGRAPESNLGA